MNLHLFRRAATQVRTALSGPHAPPLVALLAVLISLPALRLGLMSDDHLLAWQVALGDGPWGLFQIDEPRLSEFRSRGAIVWWSGPRLAVSFVRPLASLSHYLEFHAWPDEAWLMSLWNVLLYALCAFVAALLYRRTAISPWCAGLAALMFTLDEAHAMSVGWISGRNTVLALLGSLSTLYFHLRAREERSRGFAMLSALAVAFALLSAEAGSWAFGLLLAYVLVLESGSLRHRLASIAPQLVVGAVWATLYLTLGRGARGTSFYRELSTPLHALLEGLLDLPLHLTSLFGPSLIGGGVMAPTHIGRLVTLPIAMLCLWLVWPDRELRADRRFRFFAAATLSCLPPAFLAIAQDRTLMGASFGAFGWIALAIDAAGRRSAVPRRIRRGALVFLHVLLPLPLFQTSLASVGRFDHGARALAAVAEPGRELVLVNTPVELLSLYTLAILELDRPDAVPASLHQLYAGGSELWLERIDARTLDVTATRGWGHAPIERIFAAAPDMPRAGSELRARGLAIRVLSSTSAGAPERVRFTFATSLESRERKWLVWRGAQPIEFAPPSIGARVRLEPLSLMKALPP